VVGFPPLRWRLGPPTGAPLLEQDRSGDYGTDSGQDNDPPALRPLIAGQGASCVCGDCNNAYLPW